MLNQHFRNICGGANTCFRASNVKFEVVYSTDPEFLKKVLGKIRDVLQWASTIPKASYHQVHDKVTKLVSFIPEIGPFCAQFVLPLCTLVGFANPGQPQILPFWHQVWEVTKFYNRPDVVGCDDKQPFLGVIKTLPKHLDLGDDDCPSQVESQLCKSSWNRLARDVLFYGMNLYHLFLEVTGSQKSIL
jgi:hypothetical protein